MKLPQKVSLGSEMCKIERKHILKSTFLRKYRLGLQTTFFDSFSVLLSFLAENDTERI